VAEREGAALFSPTSDDKWAAFRYICNVFFRATKNLVARGRMERLLYLDLNAGPGLYSDGNHGSPLIALEVAESLRVPIEPWFFESDHRTYELLNESLERYAYEHAIAIHPTPGDHNETLPGVASRLEAERRDRRGDWYGLVFADPNGTRPAVEALRHFYADGRFYRVDLLIYVSATLAYKRIRGAGLDDAFLLEDLQRIGKRVTMLRRPTGPQQWTFALLTNWANAPLLKTLNFVRADSPEGREVLDSLNYTSREREAREPFLPFDHAPTAPMPNTSERRSSAK
jgi:three-Cys-motif partner protein